MEIGSKRVEKNRNNKSWKGKVLKYQELTEKDTKWKNVIKIISNI